MSPERNDPCPCGSGKKYKKCCGAPPVGTDAIALHRDAAYKGEIGRRRRQFCLDYTAYKKQVLAQGEKFLREKIEAAGQSISCKKGCGKCCILFIFSTLQEAECIVFYLYQNEAALRHFVTAYRDWQRGLGLFEHKLRRIDQMIARSLAGELSPEEQEQFTSDINSYTAREVNCPFLVDNACSIYEVRPYVCAGLVAVTPSEMCVWNAPGGSQAQYYKSGFKLEIEMPYFLPSRSRLLFGCLPELVQRILEAGYSFLSSIAGLERLRR